MLLGAHWSLEIVEKRFEVFKQQTHLARFTAELLDFVVAGKVPYYYVIEAIDSIAICILHGKMQHRYTS